MKKAHIIVTVGAWLLAGLTAAYGQGVTGQIGGTVTDPAGALAPGAVVMVVNDLTKQTRSFTTESNGAFLFTNLVAGDYSLRVALPGFKTYDRKGVSLSAQEQVDLHDIRLEVGDVNTSVEVQAETARVATESSDRSVLINRTMIDNTPTRGRDYLGVLRALPGVASTTTNDRPAWNSLAANINGNSAMQITLDGVVSQNSGFTPNQTGSYISPNLDAISEIRVLVGNYQAEYGSRGGGQLNVTIKSGSNKFHGTAYHFWRHEQFNANEWFNNKTRVVKPTYRFQNPGGTIGGPVLIPGTDFNKSRTKLFFFFSQEYLKTSTTGGVNSYTMPTTLERNGDFSQTATTTGVPIVIRDPSTGSPFPSNRIPSNRISPIGAAMIGLFPTPSTTDPTGNRQYNAQYQFTRDQPSQDRILRIDYNPGDKTFTYVRVIHHTQSERGYGALGFSGLGANFTGLNGGWGQFASIFDVPAYGIAATVVRTIRPNLINETTFGINRGDQVIGPLDAKTFADFNQLPLKAADGTPLSLPNFFKANDLNFRPQVVFTASGAQSAGQAVTNAPGFTFPSRWPYSAVDQVTSVTNNMTWLKGSHNMKFGFYGEHVARDIDNLAAYTVEGTYFFGSDTANPFDTGYPFSNLVLGSVQAYGEDNKRITEYARYNHIAWFAQDAWKVTRRLTFDLGIRFQVLQPAYAKGATLGLFSGSAYKASESGQLLFPALVNGQRVAINPKTGATYQFARATSFDPASFPSNGSPYSGMVQYDSKFFHTPHVQLGPRVGFAWDIFGNGKTAIRGGFGIFYDRPYGVDTIAANTSGVGPMQAPPDFRAPIYFNTTFSSLLSTQGFFATQNVNGGSRDLKLPTNYQWSFGVQRDLGRGVILDAAYVGNVSHHGFGTAYDANAVAPLTTWTPAGGPNGTRNPAYLDPTSSGGGTGAFYTANLVRAMVGYHGYGSISAWTSKGESHFNSLQVQVNRRFGSRLQFATNWTWSKYIVFSPQQWIPDNLTKNVSGRPQAVNVTVGYAIPDSSRFLGRNLVSKALLDNWRLSGVGSFFSGTPMTIGCAAQSAPIGWPNGTPTGGIPLRCQLTGELFLPEGTAPPPTQESRLWYPFNAASFALPPGSTLGLGNTPPTLTYGPGFESIDLALSKQFGLRKEGWLLEFRAEAFNALNHFNPSNPNTSLTLNYATGANTNASFGSITSTQNNSRRMALSLKLRF